MLFNDLNKLALNQFAVKKFNLQKMTEVLVAQVIADWQRNSSGISLPI